MSKKKPLSLELQAECQAANALFLEKKNLLKLSQKKIADSAGMSAAAVAMYLNGTNPLNARFASILATLLGEPVERFSPRLAAEISELSTGVAPADVAPRSHDSNVVAVDFTRQRVREGFIEIPQLNVGASMGLGQLRPEYETVIDSMTVGLDFLKQQRVTYSNTSNLALITGYGDSMEGTFNDGDVLLVDRGVNDVKIDAVYVLALKDELYIKRLQRRGDGTFTMISDNRKYDPIHITEKDLERFQVLGRVLLAWNAKKL